MVILMETVVELMRQEKPGVTPLAGTQAVGTWSNLIDTLGTHGATKPANNPTPTTST